MMGIKTKVDAAKLEHYHKRKDLVYCALNLTVHIVYRERDV